MKNKLLLVLIFLGSFVMGQVPPPPTPKEESFDIGEYKANPIDMYVVALGILAIVFIMYFVREYNKKKIA